METTGATFHISNAKLYVAVVTLCINDNIKFWENIKQGIKRTISWNKHKSEITTLAKNNNLDYLIDPTFRNINRLSFQSKIALMIPREICLQYRLGLQNR